MFLEMHELPSYFRIHIYYKREQIPHTRTSGGIHNIHIRWWYLCDPTVCQDGGLFGTESGNFEESSREYALASSWKALVIGPRSRSEAGIPERWTRTSRLSDTTSLRMVLGGNYCSTSSKQTEVLYIPWLAQIRWIGKDSAIFRHSGHDIRTMMRRVP